MIKLKNMISRSLFVESKRLRVFDFDDTLVKTTSFIYITHSDGKKSKLTPGQYAVYNERPGDVYDFRDLVYKSNDFMETKDFVPASATLLMVYGVGATLGPFLATIFMLVMGPSGLFIYSAIICSTIGIFALYRISQRNPVPEDEAENFAMVPRTSQIAFELDPRSDEFEREHD